MIEDTLNPSVEKSTAENSVENTEQVNDVTTPVVEEVAPENEEAAKTEELRGAIISDEELKNLAGKTLKEIIDTFENLVENGDIMELNRQAEYIKATFYKVLKEEKIASSYQAPSEIVAEELQVEESVDAAENEDSADAAEVEISAEGAAVNPFVEIERAFKSLYGRYKGRRAVYFQNLEREKNENLEKKLALIEELKALTESTDDINKVFAEFRNLQTREREIGPIPQARVKDVYETYSHYVEKFYDFVKINNEFRDLDFKKNLEAKIALCEKAEALVEATHIPEAFNQLQKLHEEWKDLGPVAKEFREEIWERFRAATSKVNKLHQEFFETLKSKQKENLAAKTVLCEKAEEIASRDINDSNTWNTATKEFEAIQKEWRTIGFASKKDNQKIYDRFRAACDDFYNRKRDYYASFKEKMGSNLDRKIALCEQAEALADSTDWKKTTDLLIALQKEWKEIGPVSRKKSDQVWLRFRAACDKFFENKEKNFSNRRQGRGGRSDRGREINPLRQERERLLMKYRKLESEIATYENNLGFFANSKNADSLIQEINKKIEAAKNELVALEEKIHALDVQNTQE